MVSTVFLKYLKDNGVNSPNIVEGNLGEDMWTDEQVAEVQRIAKEAGRESVFGITEDINTGKAHLSQADKAFMDRLLRDQRYVQLTAKIQTEHTDLPVPPVIWREACILACAS